MQMRSEELGRYVGKHLKFTFRNGVQVYAPVEAVYPERGEVQLILCGACDLVGVGDLPENLAHPSGLLLAPSALVRVAEVKRKSELASGAPAPREFEFAK